ncbi:MAG: SAM-dependent methyltransferase [Pseudomonadota bacterium]
MGKAPMGERNGGIGRTARRRGNDWQALASLRHTIVVYMGVGRAQSFSEALVAAGLPAHTPAAIVEKGTLPEQRIIRTQAGALGIAVADAQVEGPAVLIIGEVAARAEGQGLIELTMKEPVAA